MMNFYANNPRPSARVWVLRLSGARSGWLAKLLVPAALMALIPVALLVVVGLWAVVAVGAAIVATAALVVAPVLRRLRAAPPTAAHARTLEGEARRIDVDS